MLVFLAIPIVIGLTYQIFTDEPVSILTFFGNLITDIDDNRIFYIVQALVLLLGIWLIGGTAGRLIVKQNTSRFLVGGLTLFLLWILLFISSTLTTAIKNSIIWGQKGFESVVANWMIYGLFLYLMLGVVHGLTMGYFLGREIKEKGGK
jgi:hypothetical protein